MGSELTVDGFEAILKRLSELDTDMRDNISKKALKAGAQVIKESIQEEVHISDMHYGHGGKHIRDDIKISTPKRTETGWKINIGPGKKTAWRAKLLELGHAKPNGNGTVPPYPFMGPGLQRSQQGFMRTVSGVIREEI